MSRIAGSCGRLCLKSLEAAKFFSKVTVSFYLITRSIWKFQLFYIIANKPGRMIYLQKLSCKQVLESTETSLSFGQFSSVTQSGPTLCDPMDCSTPGYPVHHQLPQLAQTHVHRASWCHLTVSSFVGPFSSCFQSFPASGSFPVSLFFTSGGQSIGVLASASALQWTFRTDIL